MKRGHALPKTNGERAAHLEPPWWKPFLKTCYPLATVHDYAEVMRLYRSVINEGREWARTNFSERQVK
jgi:hypothetical protein